MFKHVGLAIIAVIVILGLSFLGKLVEILPASEVMVIQFPDGRLKAFTQPGIYFQGLGSATHYPLRESYEVDNQKIRFNDGGTATVTGNVQFDVPVDPEALLSMHSKFYSPDTLKAKLIAPAFIKAINASGPLVSSRESYAEKRTYLQSAIDDQMANGVYQMRPHTTIETDPLTKEEKSVTRSEISVDAKGVPIRSEVSPLFQFGVKMFGLTIADIKYDALVEKQIQQQQDIIMQVQTAIATARMAEQQAITVEAQGKASAAKSKWEQEVVKAKAVVEAQQQLEVAQLATKTADQAKQALILKAEGEAEYKRKIIVADNALTQRLATWLEGTKAWAAAYQNSKGANVPAVVMGGGGTGPNAAANVQNIMDLVSTKMARDLAVDMTMQAPVAGK